MRVLFNFATELFLFICVGKRKNCPRPSLAETSSKSCRIYTAKQKSPTHFFRLAIPSFGSCSTRSEQRGVGFGGQGFARRLLGQADNHIKNPQTSSRKTDVHVLNFTTTYHPAQVIKRMYPPIYKHDLSILNSPNWLLATGRPSCRGPSSTR